MNVPFTPAISSDLLNKSQKILFVAHLALGDFTYLQNFFHAFSLAYPHLRIDLWIDEVRRTSNPKDWKYLEKYALYDWAESCPFFSKVYKRTYSPELLRQSIKEAQLEDYPIVVSLATLRPRFYAALARQISPHGFIAAMRPKRKWFQIFQLEAYRRLDAVIEPHTELKSDTTHITDSYASWFHKLFGLDVPREERYPFVNIPEKWMTVTSEQLRQWNCHGKSKKLVFINAFAKTKKRCWPLERVGELIQEMQSQTEWRDACFIVNAVPQELDATRAAIDHYDLKNTRLFSAESNFFELPAMLSHCSLIISVETAVMHLANAVHVPVIALMRQKNPEWVPIDHKNSVVITARRRGDWVKEISTEEVMKRLRLFRH